MFYLKGPLNWVLMVLVALGYVFNWEMAFKFSLFILFVRTKIVCWPLLLFASAGTSHYERHKDRRVPQERGYW